VNQSAPRQAVLVLAHADGWLEVFAEPNVDVRIAMVPTTGTIAGESLAEAYLELALSPRYRELHWPGKLRAADRLRVLRPSELLHRDHELALLRGLNAIEQRFTPNLPGKTKVWTL
jgi:hypothetical protein